MGETKQNLPLAGKELLKWYQIHKRDLPWRKIRETYPIWISETMLQQTRVEAVKPYYERFLKRFPTPESLAAASEEEVVAIWQGLGYYSRARNLQAGVSEWIKRYGKKLPTDRKELETLKGIGPYTSGALLSQVYGLPEAAVDGNVFRVITRFCAIDEPIDQTQTRKIVSQIVLAMMPKENPGDFNQALMELGATVCIPRGFRCEKCPLQSQCMAYATGTQTEYPKKKAAKEPKLVEVLAGVLIHKEKILLRRRPAKGLLAGMWEFPSVENETLKELIQLFSSAGFEADVGKLLCGVDHIFSHRRWDLRAVEIFPTKIPRKLPENWQWHNQKEWREILWAGPHAKIATFING